MRILSISEHVAGHLRAELLAGCWVLLMPGKHEFASEPGVNHKTVDAALRLLENDGLLVPQGAGKRRAIALPGGTGRIRVAGGDSRAGEHAVVMPGLLPDDCGLRVLVSRLRRS